MTVHPCVVPYEKWESWCLVVIPDFVVYDIAFVKSAIDCFTNIEFLYLNLLWCLVSSLQTLVLFCGQGIVKVNVIRGIIASIVQEGLNRLILVVQNKITNQALKAVELLKFKVEIFQVSF